ncbi:MAG: hypothetical protein OH343_05230, partial [Candidatus Parvarchaeota archaeon]|nr:hypothetical protein [Candidatus Parvarchaeum tengchongense]
SVDNGLHLQVANNGCSSTWAGIIYNNPIDSADSIVETYSSGTRVAGPEDVGLYTGNSDTAGGYAGVADTWGWGYGTISGGYGNIGNPFDISSGSGVASIYWIGNGNEGIGWNYNFVSSTNTNEGWSSSLYASIQTGECSPNANMVYYWFRVRAYPPNGVMPSTSIGDIQDIYPFEYQYSVANFTNSTSISVPGTASTGKIWNGGHAYTLAMWVKMDHAYGTCGYPCSDLFQTNQGCTSGLEQDPYNATGYQVNLLEWNSSCGTGATAQGSPYQYVPYGKWELITGIFKYNSQGNAWIASCVDTSCTNRTWTLTAPAVYSTPATILGSNQMNGQVADVQMYDSALTLNQVNQLYNEFIGAQPVYNSTLVAWIPLDGNAYDDSGNGNTASLTSVNFLYP